LQRDEATLSTVAGLVGSTTNDVVEGVQRRLDEIKALQDELKAMRLQIAVGRASELIATAVDGIVVARVDGLASGDLRELAIAVRQAEGVRRCVLIGETNTGGVGLAAAVMSDEGVEAASLIKDAAKTAGGGGGGKGDVATAGGKNVAAIDEALEVARAAATSL